MEDIKAPRLDANSILVRPGIINDKGISLLLYCDSRYVMNALDEMYGKMGWQRRHKEVNGSVYCTISVWSKEHNCWIEREDVGTGSGAEEEKSKSSGSLKRCAVNFGIARCLYSTGLIWLKAGTYQTENRNGKIIIKDHFFVDKIDYDDSGETITELVIKNQDNKVVYEMKAKKKRSKQPSMQLTEKQIQDLYKELSRTGVPLNDVLNRYELQELHEMSPIVFNKAMNSLRKTVSKAA